MNAQLKDAGRAEREMVILGVLGLIPFFAGAAASWLAPESVSEAMLALIRNGILIYAATIISYLAGVNAGAQLSPSDERKSAQWFFPGQLAVIAAWLLSVGAIGPFNLSGPAPFWGMASLLIWLYLRDRNIPAPAVFPAWYGNLRALLTGGAVLSLMIASFAPR